MRYLSFLVLKMRYLRLFGLLAICLGVGLFSAANANAQRVTFGVGIGAPVYYGRGYGYRGGYRYYGHGGYGRGFDRGYRGGDFHGGNGYRGGGNYRGGA